MPLTLQVGLSKKIGQPNYGSLGASCNLGIELDQTLLATDVDYLQTRIRLAFAACRQAVQEELVRRPEQANLHRGAVLERAEQNDGCRPPEGAANSESLPLPQVDLPQQASRKQLEYAAQLSRKIHGLGLRRLEVLSTQMFSKAVAELNHAEASRLIDLLKEIKEGRADLNLVAEDAVDG